jgi:hypothetical protein
VRTILGQCPRCRDSQLDDRPIRSCGRCHGQWIPEDLLHDRIAAMTPAEPHRPIEWRPVVRDVPLPCAICGEAMTCVKLHEIPLDRCHMHGIWFAKDQLAHVLLRSAEPRPKPREPSTFAGDLVVMTAVDTTANVAGEVVLAGAGEAAAVGAAQLALDVAGSGLASVASEVASAGVVEVAATGATEAAGGVIDVLVEALAGLL